MSYTRTRTREGSDTRYEMVVRSRNGLGQDDSNDPVFNLCQSVHLECRQPSIDRAPREPIVAQAENSRARSCRIERRTVRSEAPDWRNGKTA